MKVHAVLRGKPCARPKRALHPRPEGRGFPRKLDKMRLLGNIIWFVFGGFVMGLGWWFAAVLSAITIIGIPFAIAAFRIGAFSFWPFGREIVDRPADASGKTLNLFGNIIWVIFCGWWLALGHLVSALLCAITIIGIPFAFQHIKLAGLAFAPFGKEIVLIGARSASV